MIPETTLVAISRELERPRAADEQPQTRAEWVTLLAGRLGRLAMTASDTEFRPHLIKLAAAAIAANQGHGTTETLVPGEC